VLLIKEIIRGDNSRSAEEYGLGLSLVKRILNKHNFKFSYQYDEGFNLFVINP